jgi:hypothetical protein
VIAGSRYFGASDLPASGGGPWNGTIKPGRPSYIEELLDEAAANDCRILILPCGPTGSNSPVMSGGRFSPTNWKRLVGELGDSGLLDQNHPGFFGFYLLDEPKLVPRWGYAISNDVLEDMALFARQYWDTAPMYYRVAPSQIGESLSGSIRLWLTYRQGRGGTPLQYYTREQSIGTSLGFPLMYSLNCTHYTSAGDPISVADYRKALDAAISVGVNADGFNHWDYRSGSWYDQTGMAALVEEKANEWHSFDP